MAGLVEWCFEPGTPVSVQSIWAEGLLRARSTSCDPRCSVHLSLHGQDPDQKSLAISQQLRWISGCGGGGVIAGPRQLRHAAVDLVPRLKPSAAGLPVDGLEQRRAGRDLVGVFWIFAAPPPPFLPKVELFWIANYARLSLAQAELVLFDISPVSKLSLLRLVWIQGPFSGRRTSCLRLPW